MCERDRPETGCKLRSVFFCAAALPYRNTPPRAHTAPQMACAAALCYASGYRWHVLRLYAMRAATDGMCCGSMLCERLPSAQAAALPCRNTPQRAHRQPQRWLPAQYTIGRETDRLSGYRGHALRLYTMTAGQIHTGTGCGSTMRARTHTIGAQERHTDSLSGHRWHVYFFER